MASRSGGSLAGPIVATILQSRARISAPWPGEIQCVAGKVQGLGNASWELKHPNTDFIRRSTRMTTSRPRHKMPAPIKAALQKHGVLAAYNRRPAYQRNDYLGWIAQAKTDATKAKRTAQMLNELERGGVYMGMQHAPSAKAKAAPKRAR
jgi:hypothetical protein